MADFKVVTPDDLDNKTIRLNDENKVEAVFDLGSLPVKSSDSNSSIVAIDPDGEPYRFPLYKNSSNGVLLHASVTKSKERENDVEHTVHISVTNLRSTAISAFISLTTSSRVTDFYSSSSGTVLSGLQVEWADTQVYQIDTDAEESSDFYVTVLGLRANPDYMFIQLSVNDAAMSTNHAVVKLTNDLIPEAPPAKYTEECPAVTATTADGMVLTQTTQATEALSIPDTEKPMFINFIDQTNLNGLVLNFEGASSVEVYVGSTNRNYRFKGIAMVRQLEENKYRTWEFITDRYGEATTDDYTFIDGKMTFTTDHTSAIIYVRTGTAECKWQCYYIGRLKGDTTASLHYYDTIVTGLDPQYYAHDTSGSEVFSSETFTEHLKSIDDEPNIQTNLTNVRVYNSDIHPDDYYTYYITDTALARKSKLVIRLPQGQAFSFELSEDIPFGFGQAVYLPARQGAVKIYNYRKSIDVSSSARPTDSVYTQLADIIIE